MNLLLTAPRNSEQLKEQRQLLRRAWDELSQKVREALD